MDRKPTYYEVLELEPSADTAKIKAAYRRLARKYHPDINPDDPGAEAKFKRIGEAYAVLSNPQKRMAYDQTLGLKPQAKDVTGKRTDGKAGTGKKATAQATASKSAAQGKTTSSQRSGGASDQAGGSTSFDAQSAKFKEMFDALFRKEGRKTEKKTVDPPPPADKPSSPPPPASQHKSARQSSSQKPVRGEDITVDAFISREEAELGVTKTVNVQHTEICKRCSGTGKVNGVLCTACHGDKQLVTLRKIDVRIPAGVKGGSKVRVAKEGGRGIAGGDPGDLFLVIRIEDEQALKIDGLNVSCEIPISITEAVLGAEIDVPTLHGKVKMVIPPQTSSGRVFRLKGQGVARNGATGDQYVTVQIVVPKTLSARERELYQELARLQKDSPRK